MSSTQKLLPTELAALVQHVELNRAGWWDKAVHRLVLSSIWLAGKPLSVAEIQASLKEDFHLVLSAGKVNAAVQALESQSTLIRFNGPSFRIPEDKRSIFEAEIAEAEQAASKARSYFSALITELCSELEAESTWQAFESEFLAPLIKEVGANAYRLIAGERMTVDKSIVRRFLGRFEAKFHHSLSEIVSRFLDPKKDEVRAYISRLLHATFCVEASGLPEKVIEKLNITSSGKQINFRIFVDTNFLFSILALHENPSNAAAHELQSVIAALKGNPNVSLHVTPRTIDEAKHSISLAKAQLTGVPSGMNFTNAAIKVGFSGMAEKFLEERRRRNGELSPDDWFDPYLNNFVSIARGNGVELFNEKLDEYATRQDVIDDILLVMKTEGRRTGRRKSYEMVEHDMILWHLANDKRSSYIESPIDAKDWILTLDFRLIGFDEHKQKHSGAKVPLCIHPTSLIQLLQFWVPRTKEFEEAILGSIRLPFLFQEIDTEAERTSLRILKGIGRFENSEHLSEEAIADVVLNEGLRGRLKGEKSEESETALIRDALLDEMKMCAEAEKVRAQQLDAELRRRDSKLSVLDSETRIKDEAIDELKGKVSEEEAKAREAESKLHAQGLEIEALKAKWQKSEDMSKWRYSLAAYAVLLLAVVATSFGAAVRGAIYVPELVSLIGNDASRWFIGIVAFVFFHLALELSVGRNNQMSNLWPFQQISRFRGWLWSLVILSFALGIVGNLVANRIQQNLDNLKSAPPVEPVAEQSK